jgi:hypothetical protein
MTAAAVQGKRRVFQADGGVPSRLETRRADSAADYAFEKLNVTAITQGAVTVVERVAARFNIRLPDLRKLQNPE